MIHCEYCIKGLKECSDQECSCYVIVDNGSDFCAYDRVISYMKEHNKSREELLDNYCQYPERNNCIGCAFNLLPAFSDGGCAVDVAIPYITEKAPITEK